MQRFVSTKEYSIKKLFSCERVYFYIREFNEKVCSIERVVFKNSHLEKVFVESLIKLNVACPKEIMLHSAYV